MYDKNRYEGMLPRIDATFQMPKVIMVYPDVASAGSHKYETHIEGFSDAALDAVSEMLDRSPEEHFDEMLQNPQTMCDTWFLPRNVTRLVEPRSDRYVAEGLQQIKTRYTIFDGRATSAIVGTRVYERIVQTSLLNGQSLTETEYNVGELVETYGSYAWAALSRLLMYFQVKDARFYDRPLHRRDRRNERLNAESRDYVIVGRRESARLPQQERVLRAADLECRQHIVRAHARTYTHPRFTNVRGQTQIIPSHVRGSLGVAPQHTEYHAYVTRQPERNA